MAPRYTHGARLLFEIIALVHLAALFGLTDAKPMDRDEINPLQLSTFKGYQYDYSLGKAGVYKFFYSLPTSSRQEQRNEDGEVSGSYSFVAPEGEEYDFKYEADKKGFRVESDALPESPKDTEEVRKAKEEFFEAYKKALQLVSSTESERNNHGKEEGDGGEEEEEGDEEESDEESSEEDDDDEESSEEDDNDDEESSEEDSEEEEEGEEEEKEGGVESAKIGRGKVVYQKPISKAPFTSQVPNKSFGSKKRGGSTSTFKRPIFISSLPPKRISARQSSASTGSSGSYGTKVPGRKSYYYARK